MQWQNSYACIQHTQRKNLYVLNQKWLKENQHEVSWLVVAWPPRVARAASLFTVAQFRSYSLWTTVHNSSKARALLEISHRQPL